jgi:hypothetical protein
MTAPPEPFTAVQRRTLEAVLAVILPSTSGPGAREAGAVDYVVDVLGKKPQAVTVEQLRQFLDAAQADPDAVLSGLEGDRAPAAQEMFVTLRALAWEGYLCDPGRLGNRDAVGWTRLGFEGPTKRRGHAVPPA